MGKPFKKELLDIPNTLLKTFLDPLDLTLKELVESISPFPLLVVGSGGSLSGAYFIARLHEQATGLVAKAITPLELMLSTLDPCRHAILFVTANGNNRDIINSFQIAIEKEFAAVGIVCASKGSKIIAQAKHYPRNVRYFEFMNPSGKDGFIAVNSLLSTCVWMGRGYGLLATSQESVTHIIQRIEDFDSENLHLILERQSIVVLGGEWSWPAVLDMESKFSEVGLGNVLISDLRNFGHGRHNWFDKKGIESTILVLATPPLVKLAEKTLSYLPINYPSMIIKSPFTGPLAGIDLLTQVFYLVYEAGTRVSIDPGKPGVPNYGSKIYHIAFSPSLRTSKHKPIKELWAERKSRVLNTSSSSIMPFLDTFLLGFKNTTFSSIIFDYDGTLCDSTERFLQLKPAIGVALNNLLSNHIHIGIATGRGRSVQESLCKVIDEKHWEKVLVGNYNGASILPLASKLPEFREISSSIVQDAYNILKNDSLLAQLADLDPRAKQVSVTPKSSLFKQVIRTKVAEILSILPQIKITESDHSIDILDPEVSKLIIIEAIHSITRIEGNILTIGDQGQYGGNDFELLNAPQSLSVDKISSSLETCWNLSPIGCRGADAALYIMDSLIIDKDNELFYLDTDYLAKVGDK